MALEDNWLLINKSYDFAEFGGALSRFPSEFYLSFGMKTSFSFK